MAIYLSLRLAATRPVEPRLPAKAKRIVKILVFATFFRFYGEAPAGQAATAFRRRTLSIEIAASRASLPSEQPPPATTRSSSPSITRCSVGVSAICGMALPSRRDIALGTPIAMAAKLPWLLRMRRELPRITFGNYARPGETAGIEELASRMARLLDPAMSWADVDALQALEGQLILKGILHPLEAREAVARGVDGLVVSNHGGRQLDGAAAWIEALPAVLAAVDARVPVLLDGGIRRGTDVVKALCLGATACLIGRPQSWGSCGQRRSRRRPCARTT